MAQEPDRGTLLEVRGLRVDYTGTGGAVTAVDGVDLTVARGETVAVVGESGSGKSTTALAVTRLLPHTARIAGGRVLFRGQDLAALGDGALRPLRGRAIGFVPQDPGVALNPVQRVGDQIAEVLRIHRIARGREAHAEAVEALASAGVPEPAARALQYPHQLSGGMRQRVLIAMALVAGPDLVVADEPTSGLDVTVQRRVLDHLEALTRDRGIALLLITHDLGVAADRADRVVVMSEGQVVETGVTAQVLDRPVHPYTRRLMAAAPRWSPSAGTGIGTAPADAAKAAATTADRTDGAAPPLLEVSGLTRDFDLPRGSGRGRTLRAVDGLDFTLARGEALALVGESGSGKSTTARLVLRLDRPTAGTVRLDGVDLASLTSRQLRDSRRRMQLVYQNPFASLDPRFTVRRIVEEPLRAFRIGDRAERRAEAARLLDLVALPARFLERRPAELSGGQRQRVAIARALALRPDLLVCDEPVSALDVSVQAQILELLAELRKELGLGYLFITHDLAVARQLCDRVAVLRDGRLVETGPTERVFAEPVHEYTRELLAAVPGGRRH
ncbi:MULTISPECIES: ABC transporter ATP-binding protein [Streptacidiphilus]|uniref:Dipeptide ABC transporter ATP-binding protein n=1 Tax=Streptacidiphilus cavernicola TaxID=3342716 RepID=A0ABV6UMK6_9ACTN|nr:ABC transporter ATP-binding protein [Streptacidiphilus jeojiense]